MRDNELFVVTRCHVVVTRSIYRFSVSYTQSVTT